MTITQPIDAVTCEADEVAIRYTVVGFHGEPYAVHETIQVRPEPGKEWHLVLTEATEARAKEEQARIDAIKAAYGR